jgi:hypothetical protein
MAREIQGGSWFGHFSYGPATSPAGRNPTQMELELRGSRLVARGRDVDGRYEVEGELGEQGQVRWIKRYESGMGKGMRVAYLGTWDPEAGEIAGRWRTVDQAAHGTFALRPGQAEDLVDDSAVRDVLTSASRWRDQVALDLEAVRFDGERAMLGVLGQDPDFVAAVRGAKAVEQVGSLESGPDLRFFPRIRLSPATLPIAFHALDRCREVLGLGQVPVELYVENNGALNAYVETTPDGRIQITFTAAVLDRLDLDEITSIVGHELGHALLGHLETRVASDADLSGIIQLRRLALARYQELSADRVGLLCMGDLDKALRTEFLLHSGITARERVGSAERIEATALEAVAQGEGRAHGELGGYDSHPCGAFRTLALAWFGRSAPFWALRGLPAPEGALSEDELERKVSELVSVMNPAVLDSTLSTAELDELVALTGLAVAEADSQATQRETQAIRRLSAGVAEAMGRVQQLSFEERQLRTLDLAEKLAVTLPLPARERIVEDLTMIAQVDGHLSEAELVVLDGVSLLLQVGGGLALGVLGELQGGLD